MVTIPPTDDRTVFRKETPRKGIDFSYCTIAGRADGKGETVSSVKLVLGSISMKPITLVRASEIVEQAGLTDAAIEKAVESTRDELGALSNLYSPAAYKRELAKVLVKRALVWLRKK